MHNNVTWSLTFVTLLSITRKIQNYWYQQCIEYIDTPSINEPVKLEGSNQSILFITAILDSE